MVQLMLGVQRRQRLLGLKTSKEGGEEAGVSMPVSTITAGQTKSIVEPLEKAIQVYKEVGNERQAAAAHYQLATFYSRVWTAQADRKRTRDKLSSALSHYHQAFTYFNNKGVGSTLVLIVLELADLYMTVHKAAAEGEVTCLNQVNVGRSLLCVCGTIFWFFFG